MITSTAGFGGVCLFLNLHKKTQKSPQCFFLQIPSIFNVSVRIRAVSPHLLYSTFPRTPCWASCLQSPLLRFYCLALEQRGFLTVVSHTFSSVIRKTKNKYYPALSTLNAPLGSDSGGTCWDSFRKSLIASFYVLIAALEAGLES